MRQNIGWLRMYKNKVSVIKMKLLRWMSSKTQLDKISKENIRESVRVSPIVEKMVKKRFRWFVHVERRSIDSIVRMVDRIEIRKTIRGSRRFRKIVWEVIKKDIKINDLNRNMIHGRTL